MESAGAGPEKRLAVLEKHHDTIRKRDDVLAREIALQIDVGHYDRALELLSGREFHIWEGTGRTAVHNSFVEAHLRRGQAHFAAARYGEALKEYSAALDYPPNLGTGRPLRGERLSEIYFHVGQAHEALGHAAEARKSFELAIATAPAELVPRRSVAAEEPDVYFYAGHALEKCGRAAESARVFGGLVEAGNALLVDHVPMYFFASHGQPQPSRIRQAQAYYAIGLGHLGANRPAEAKNAFAKALELNRNHTAARRQLLGLKDPGGAKTASRTGL